MDRAQRLLFGGFPRSMGVTTPEWGDTELKQYLVHSEREFDGVLEKVSGERNIYSSISVYDPVRVGDAFEGCAVKADKVSFDFDSSAKAETHEDRRWSSPLVPDEAADARVIGLMRSDPDILDEILGDVCHNVNELASACLEDDIPVVGVFSGFGIHVHQLYRPTRSRPGDKMASTCRKFVSELNLSCADEKASGKPFRILRVPNIERVCHEYESGTSLFTIPLRAAEMAEITPEDLMDLCRSERNPSGLEPPQRPEMKVHADYLGPGYEEGVGQEKMRPVPSERVGSELARKLVREVTQMPCVYERALSRNPPNDVRVKLGIMFLNAGYSPSEAADIFSQIGWVDFDKEVTEYQLNKLLESGKGDWSCKTMQAKGLCVRADEKRECETYGYQGGNKPW